MTSVTHEDATATTPRPPRADARRNRARILEVAEEVFAEGGPSAPVDDIARRAGVGVGTLYRHFPTKEALLEAIVVERFARLLDYARGLTGAADAGAAFFDFLAQMIQVGLAKRDFADALASAGIDVSSDHRDLFEDMLRVGETLLARAQEVGAVRREVAIADIVCLISGTCMATNQAMASAPELISSPDRLFAIISAGLRPA